MDFIRNKIMVLELPENMAIDEIDPLDGVNILLEKYLEDKQMLVKSMSVLKADGKDRIYLLLEHESYA